MSIDHPTARANKVSDPASSHPLWALLLSLAAARRGRSGQPRRGAWRLDDDGQCVTTDQDDPNAAVIWDEHGLRAGPHQPEPISDLVALYAPLFPTEPHSSVVVAHLGQSIDAQIATRSGDSCFVTGPANIVHLHRLRALSDAVIVGAGTAVADNPRLTTRLVDGDNPVRVVIDPNRRTPQDLGLFHDGAAPSLLACAIDRRTADDKDGSVIGVNRLGDGLALPELVDALNERGLRVLFIEGGGVTVSRWMTAGLVDRLHVAVAPVFIGDGRPSLQLPAMAAMSDCRRPPARLFRLGDDLLWDFDLRGDDQRPPGQPDAQAYWPSRLA